MQQADKVDARVPIPVIQYGAVVGHFEHIKQSGRDFSNADRFLVQKWLGSESQTIVEATAQELSRLRGVPGFSEEEAVDLLLSSLSSCTGGSGRAALVRALWGIFVANTLKEGSQSGESDASRGILAKTLMAHPETEEELLVDITLLLASWPKRSHSEQQKLWAAMKPFFVFVLLQPDPKGERQGFAPALHQSLLKFAARPGPLRRKVLDLLCGLTKFLTIDRHERRLWVLQALAGLLEAVMAVEDEEVRKGKVRQVTAAAVQFCGELQGMGCPVGMPIFQTLRAVARCYPDILLPHVATLASLATGIGDGSDCYEVVAITLQAMKPSPSGNSPADAPSNNLLIQPLMWSLALQTSDNGRAWAAHVLALLGNTAGVPAGSTQPTRLAISRTGCGLTIEAAADLLAGFRGKIGEATALAWLKAFRQGLECSMTKQCSSQMVDSALPMLLGALLMPPSESAVQLEALAAMVALARAQPLMGIVLLPVLLYILQSPDGCAKMTAKVKLALLDTVPDLATHSACFPFCLRFLQPMSDAGLPEEMQILALRLSTRLWAASRRHFIRLQATLLGYAGPGSRPSMPLRAARATCIREVCKQDPSKATELVTGIQDMMQDEEDAVAAMGFDCVIMLCDADVLEFYGAWGVVQASFPGLPQQRPLLAARWVRLLSFGSLDAKADPERASAIIDLLWLAARDESPQIRMEAYTALCSYAMADMEVLGTLRPLRDFSQLLLDEMHESARQATIPLVQRALEHEHSIRRRFIAGKPSDAAPSRVAARRNPPARRLAHDLPKALLAKPATLSTGAMMLLWLPPKERQGGPSVQAAYEEFAASALWSSSSYLGPGPLGHHSLVIHSWHCFITRWLLAAHRSLSQGHSKQDIAKGLFEKLLAEAFKDSHASENAMIAAGALCSMVGEAASDFAGTLVPLLLDLLNSDRPTAVRCSAAIALGLATSQLHPTDLKGRLDAAQKLQGVLADPGAPEGVRSACAEALGLLALKLSATLDDQEVYEAKSEKLALVKRLLGLLLGALIALKPEFRVVEHRLEDSQIKSSARNNSSLENASGGISVGGFAGMAYASAAAAKIDGGMIEGLLHVISQLSINVWPPHLLQGACLLLPSLLQSTPGEGGEGHRSNLEQYLGLLEHVFNERQEGSVKGTAAAALGCIVSQGSTSEAIVERWLPLLSPLVTAHQFSGSIALMNGIASGLGAMLGAPQVLPGSVALSHPPPDTSDKAAVATSSVLKALETMTQSKELVPGKAHSLWVLAAASAAARRANQRPQLGSNEAALAKGLDGLQPDGALLPLIHFASQYSSEGAAITTEVLQTLLAVLQALQAAPRLPHFHWGRLCRHWLAYGAQICSHEGTSLQEHVLRFAMSHGGHPSTGLSQFLDDVMQPQAFHRLHESLQELLLNQLPDVMAALAAGRRSNVLLLLQNAHGQVATAAWKGISKSFLLGGNQVPLEDALKATAGLLLALPGPPVLQCGEQLLPADDVAPTQPDECRAWHNRRLWHAATECLSLLTDQQLSVLLETEGCVTTAIRIWLVARNRLPSAGNLEFCRNRCIEADPDTGEQLMMQMAPVAMLLSLADQQQMLLVTFDAVNVCMQPLQALKMASLLAAAFSCAARAVPAELQLLCQPSDSALSIFPHTLSVLLRHPHWKSVSGDLLLRIGGLLDTEFRCIAAACLVACRDLLAPSMSQQLCRAALEWTRS